MRPRRFRQEVLVFFCMRAIYPYRVCVARALETVMTDHPNEGHHHIASCCARGHAPAAPVSAEGKVKDPVCGMLVDPATAQHRAEHEGRAYHFCSAGCRAKFLADPERYVVPT